MGCSTSFAKMILFIFNVAFFIFGIVSLSVGIWVVSSRSELFKFLNLIDTHVSDSSNRNEIDRVANQHGLVETSGYMLIGLGLFTLLVGFCGCCGAMKENKCLLTVYAVLIGLVLILELSAAIVAGVFQARVRGEATDGLLNLQNKFFISVPEYTSRNSSAKSGVAYLINYMQIYFECCGAKSVGDIASSPSWLASSRDYEGKQLRTPVSCCAVKDRQAMLHPGYDWSSFNSSSLLDADCPFVANSSSMHNRTCYTGITEFVGKYSMPLIAISICIALIELIGVLFACCLINSLDNDKNYAK